jgi:hypothetical protein
MVVVAGLGHEAGDSERPARLRVPASFRETGAFRVRVVSVAKRTSEPVEAHVVGLALRQGGKEVGAAALRGAVFILEQLDLDARELMRGELGAVESDWAAVGHEEGTPNDALCGEPVAVVTVGADRHALGAVHRDGAVLAVARSQRVGEGPHVDCRGIATGYCV